MKSGTFLLLGGTLALAGCSSQSAVGNSPSPTPKAVATAKAQPPTATVDPQPTAISAINSTPVAPVAGVAYYQRGTNDLRARNYAAARQDFRLAIAAKQHLPESYTGLGTATYELGDYPTAYHAYSSAAALQPKNPAVLYYAGYSALHARDFHAALSYATRYIHLRPRDANGYHLRLLAYGQLYMQAPQVTDARTIVALRPRDPEAYNDLGIALSNNSKFAQAVQVFTKAIALQPSDATLYTNRAIAENLNKQQTLALKDLYTARSLTRDPYTQKRIDLAIANLKKFMQHG